MTREIVSYHDVLQEPTCQPSPKDVVIFTLRGLFEDLKREQKVRSELIGDIRTHLTDAVRISTQVQLDLQNIYKELNKLGKEVRVFTT